MMFISCLENVSLNATGSLLVFNLRNKREEYVAERTLRLLQFSTFRTQQSETMGKKAADKRNDDGKR